MNTIEQKKYLAVDVSKKTLDVATSESLVRRYKNDSSGINAIVELAKDSIVVFESTGGYEKQLEFALHQEEISLAILDPKKVRNFARSIGMKAKTDKLDALMLLKYAITMKPELTKPENQTITLLKSLQTRREQLSKNLVQEKNHLKAPNLQIDCQGSIKAAIVFLTKEIKKIDILITKAINSEQVLKQKRAQLLTIKGIGEHVSSLLIADLPELGTINRNKIASLAGVAPFNRDSGKFCGKRSIYAGRYRVRTALFMATLSAISHNKIIKAIYLRLVQRGKRKMIAFVACMRKLLIICNSELRKSCQI